ncbi:MAG TPA: DUF1259 domain-containing protein, partial [Thermoanaerobaculia bacterium]|nr:DUF1259 domain-containing protein [Thermoanaerobaculia bacterium]
MKRTLFAAALGLLFFLSSSPAMFAGPTAEGGWDATDKVFGQTGKDLPGEVHRYGWPRSDLHVTLGGVTVEPGLALGAWA